MPETSGDHGAGSTHSELIGAIGDIVQARDVSGGVHFHYGSGSPGPSPQELPRGIRVFVNRLPDLTDLDDLLTDPRSDDDTIVVYVVTGTAGVGKTSLALHWAHRVRDRFPDGQLYIDLRGYDPGFPVTPNQALERFLIALGVPSAAVPSDVEAKSSLYRTILARRRILVILDNVGTIGQVRPLLPGASHSLAVVTSRNRLPGLEIRDGARRRTLETLTEAESIRLLTATTSGYRTGDDPADLAELARLCAHLPLALRIAAERASSRPGTPLSRFITNLRDESALWSSLSTGDPDEAEAVRSVFAWSYRALPKDAARIFCYLGLHPGNEFSEAAAQALVGSDANEVSTALDTLAGACLLEHRGHDRYHFHDLLRAYAVDQARYELSQDAQLASVERICDWYLRTAYNCVTSLAHDATLLFTLEPSEVTALSFGERAEAAQWYADEKSNLEGAVRAAAGTQQLLTAWRLAAVLERIYATYNHVNDWRTTSEIGLAAAHELGLRVNEAVMHESLGRLSRMTMRLDAAADHYRDAITIYRELDDQPSLVKALNGLGWVHLFQHRLREADVALRNALSIVRNLDDQYWTATILFSLGFTGLQLRELDDAERYLTESLHSFRALDDALYESMVLTGTSSVTLLRGDTAHALADAVRAVEISREMDNQLWEATALLYLGKAQRARGDAAEALVSYQRAAVICRREGDLSREAMAIAGAGHAYRDLDRATDAVNFFRQAVAIHRQLDDRWKLAKALGHLADAVDRTEDAADVTSYRREASTILADFPDPKSAALRTSIAAALGEG